MALEEIPMPQAIICQPRRFVWAIELLKVYGVKFSLSFLLLLSFFFLFFFYFLEGRRGVVPCQLSCRFENFLDGSMGLEVETVTRFYKSIHVESQDIHVKCQKKLINK